MKYLYLKLGKKNSHLEYMLQLNKIENLFKREFAAIYFGKIKTERIKELCKLSNNEVDSMRKKDIVIPTSKELHNQIEQFINAGKDSDVKFISIFNNEVFIFEPDSEVKDMKEKETLDFYNDLENQKVKVIKSSLPKYMFVKKINRYLEGVPHILRTFNTSKKYGCIVCC